MTLSTYDLPFIHFCIKPKSGTKYTIGCERRHLMLIHTGCAVNFYDEVFSSRRLQLFRIGHVKKGVLTILTFVTLKGLK